MYGMINNAIKELVVESFGEKSWNNIVAKISCPHHEFNTLEPYDDSTTYDIVAAASEELKVTPAEVLHLFGKHWVGYTRNNGYGVLMDMFGNTFVESLRNLNQLHMRMGYSMPEMRAPDFRVQKELKDGSILLEYHSTREGLSSMVTGLLESMAEKYGQKAKVSIIDREPGQDYELFHIEML